MLLDNFNFINFRNFKKVKWSANITKQFGFKSISIHYVEALMEAPLQLALQIYVLSRGQSPGKFQDKLLQCRNISFDKLCFYFLIYLHRRQLYFYGIVCLLISETIQIVSILSSFATVVFNMADINRVGEEFKSIPKVFAKICALLTFAVSVCYRVMTLVFIIWLLSR